MTSDLFQAVSALVAALVFVVWVKPDIFMVLRDKDSSYPSLGRQGQFTALIVSTWVVVAITLKGGIQEWLFIGYMIAWAGAGFGSIWLKLKGQSVGAVTETKATATITTATTTTPEAKGLT